MFKPLALFIGLRYTRAKRRNHFISFISLASMFGIALGVTVLITVLSVMNGFDYQIRTRLFSMARQVTVTEVTAGIDNWQHLNTKVEEFPGVVAAAPFVSGQGMLADHGQVQPVLLLGVDPTLEAKVSQVPKEIIAGSFKHLKTNGFGIVIGYRLAETLGVVVGDKVTLFVPRATATPLGIFPTVKRFTVVGIFNAGADFGYDKTVAYIQLNDAQKLFSLSDRISGLRLKVDDLYAAPTIGDGLQQKLPPNYLVTNWTQEYGAFFKAIALEKTMMFVILLLIIAVAAFNLVSSLVMVVTDKRAEIAILRTLGATPKMIMAIFMVQGTLVGLVGTFAGLIGGVILAINAPAIVNFIQTLFHVNFVSSSVYFIDFLPSRLEWSDVWHICLIALAMSFLATLYPAWQAMRTQPAEALRYE